MTDERRKWNSLSLSLGIYVGGIEKRTGGKKTTYAITLADDLVVVCYARTLLSQARLRRLLFEATNQSFPTFRSVDWDAVRSEISQMVRVSSGQA